MSGAWQSTCHSDIVSSSSSLLPFPFSLPFAGHRVRRRGLIEDKRSVSRVLRQDHHDVLLCLLDHRQVSLFRRPHLLLHLLLLLLRLRMNTLSVGLHKLATIAVAPRLVPPALNVGHDPQRGKGAKVESHGRSNSSPGRFAVILETSMYEKAGTPHHKVRAQGVLQTVPAVLPLPV